MSASSTFLNLPPEKQQRILDGALSEFAENGYAKASLNTLVAKLGISKGSIFQYFGDKAGLFAGVFGHAVEMVKDQLRGVRSDSAGQDIFTRLEQSLVAGLLLIQAQPRLFQLYLRIMFEEGVPHRSELLSAVRFFSRDYIMDLLADGIAAGEVRPGLDQEAAAFVLDAALERFLVAFSQQHMDTGLDLHNADIDRAAKSAAAVVDVLRRGLEKA